MSTFPSAKILTVNLGENTTEISFLPGELYRLYPGGSSLATYLILQEMNNPKADALSPENVLVMAVSPFVGMAFTGNSRMVVAAKSPLTGTIGDSQSGGFFPAQLGANLWDAIVFKGRAKTPVYLFVDGENVSLRDASQIWGKDTCDTEKAIREELGDAVEISCIGPAGENKVLYAAILHQSNRANGRNGLGAVMGSKNLKAVVVAKKSARKPAFPTAFNDYFAKNALQRLEDNESVSGLGQFGTAGDTEGFSDEGFLPTRNWSSGFFPEGAKKITGETMHDTILKKRDTCFACVIRCKRVVEIPGKVDPVYGGPEYETVATMGSYCGVTDLSDICLANQLCNQYGLDTISCGATIAFAMECFEKGLLTLKDTDGLALTFGNGSLFPILIPKIAKKEGFGALLSLGSARMADHIKGGSAEFVVAVKKQELPAHMPQWKPAVGIVYAVNPFGADHQSSEHDPFLVAPPDAQSRTRLAQLGLWKGYPDNYALDSEKIRFAFETQCYFSMLDTLCLCQFAWGPSWELYGPDDLIALCALGLGWQTSTTELLNIGERRINMMRWFNQQNGFSKKDDVLPDRLFQAMPDGPSAGVRLDKKTFYKGVDQYYRFAGWDPETGNPTESNLHKLSLTWLVDRK